MKRCGDSIWVKSTQVFAGLACCRLFVAHLSLPEVGLTAHCRISRTDNVCHCKAGTRPALFHGNLNIIGPV